MANTSLRNKITLVCILFSFLTTCSSQEIARRSSLTAKTTLYYTIKDIVNEEKAGALAVKSATEADFSFKPCNDLIYDLTTFYYDGAIKEDEVYDRFLFHAFYFTWIENLLIAAGYPVDSVRSWVLKAERSLLDSSPEDPEAFFLRVLKEANLFRKDHLKLPQFYDKEWDGCGGPLPTTLFQGEGLTGLYLIPRGLHKICSRYWKVDADNLDECHYWRGVTVSPAQEEPVGGWYRYRALWEDGKMTWGYIDFDYQVNSVTVIKRN